MSVLTRLASVGVFVLLAVLPLPGMAAELVYVFSPGCPYCRLWDKEIAPIYEKTDEGKRAPIRKIDLRDPELAGVRLERPVHYTPTFVLMQDGVELGRIEGYPGEDFFWGRLARLLEKLPAPTPETTGKNKT